MQQTSSGGKGLNKSEENLIKVKESVRTDNMKLTLGALGLDVRCAEVVAAPPVG